MNLIPLPAFPDNDLWVLHDGRRARVVDPADAQPVLACLQRDGLQLEAILVTHHRPDHTGELIHLFLRTRIARVAQAARPRQRHPAPRCGGLRRSRAVKNEFK